MKIMKENVVYILGILEEDGVIDSYKFYKNENSIVVEGVGNFSTKTCFRFDDNNNLIDPKMAKLDKEILKLQNQINDLKRRKKLLEKK